MGRCIRYYYPAMSNVPTFKIIQEEDGEEVWVDIPKPTLRIRAAHPWVDPENLPLDYSSGRYNTEWGCQELEKPFEIVFEPELEDCPLHG